MNVQAAFAFPRTCVIRPCSFAFGARFRPSSPSRHLYYVPAARVPFGGGACPLPPASLSAGASLYGIPKASAVR